MYQKSSTAPSRADPVVVFPLCRWCPQQETSQPTHPICHSELREETEQHQLVFHIFLFLSWYFDNKRRFCSVEHIHYTVWQQPLSSHSQDMPEFSCACEIYFYKFIASWKTVVSPVHLQCRYHSLSLSNWANIVLSSFNLTHLPVVPHICVSQSGQHWLR